jgi:hypothetical protein
LSYRARGTTKPAILACEEGDGSQDSCILKEKKLAVDKLLWVFEANSLVFGDLSTNFVKLRETLSSEGDVRVRRRARESSESSTALSEDTWAESGYRSSLNRSTSAINFDDTTEICFEVRRRIG